MRCPSCGKQQPMSFQCGSCGTPMVKRSGSVARRARSHAAPAAIENPYAAPQARSHSPGSAVGQPLASRGSRLTASVLDGVMYLLAMIPGIALALYLGLSGASEEQVSQLTLLMLLGPAVVFFYNARLLGREGQTLGKRVRKIRIVRYDDGGNPGYSRAFWMRYFLNGLLSNVPGYGLIDVLFIFGSEQRCIHDYLAGTKVVEA